MEPALPDGEYELRAGGGLLNRFETSYLGLELQSPFVPSASPLSKDLDMIRRLEDAGASAIVLYSLFEEEISAGPNAVGRKIEESYVEIVEAVRRTDAIPLALKLSPFLSSMAEMATRLAEAGADVTMLCSVLLQRGAEHLGVLRKGVLDWLDEHEYESVAQIRGILSHRTSPDPAAFERANYIETLRRWI